MCGPGWVEPRSRELRALLTQKGISQIGLGLHGRLTGETETWKTRRDKQRTWWVTLMAVAPPTG